MPLTLDVEKQSFEFDASWSSAFKYDDTTFYTGGPQRLQGALTKQSGGTTVSRPQGTKAVDVVGLRDTGGLLLLEAKDFRGHQAANAHRMSGEVCLEVALKVRDTIAGIVGAARMAVVEFPAVQVAAALQPGPDLMVVLWLEDDLFTDPVKTASKLQVLNSLLKTKLTWLNARTFVVSSSKDAHLIPGLTVSDLP
ncbi:MAG: hypothetical protein IAE77_01815 [Prosthecobacter sp.]|jgi:hypothetical protein|uniref:hypothetical protein n=1 Tax=Prosthecobacter sp. TaxID=1965333 RepID=UPI0019E2AE79|nr:hypothetical protein [Prosthecobacter sp.]MBE2282180.1 hypothetical protein [Prosthecobacter sp.]